ncbi:MAG: hypothetical protein ACO2ZL_03440 [Flavobacteriales bacterium]
MNFKRILVAVIALSIAFGLYQYFRPAENRLDAEATASVEAAVLYEVISGEDDAAKSDFFDRIIAITGIVSSRDGNTLILQPGVACRLEVAPTTDLAIGTPVTVKGRVIGYDDMFMEVQVDFAMIDSGI